MIPCTRPEYASGLSLFQHQYLRKEAGVRLGRETAVDTLMETRARMHETVGAEICAKDNTTKVRLARVAGINSNAVLAGEQRSVTNIFGQSITGTPEQSSISSLAEQSSAVIASITNVRRPAWGA